MIWLECFLKAQCFPPALSHWSYPVKIIQWQWRCTVCHLTKTFFPSKKQWGESKTKTYEEWRAPRRAGRVSAACLGWGSFPPTRHWGLRRVSWGGVCFLSATVSEVPQTGTLPLFFWTERHQERLWLSHMFAGTLQIFSQGGGEVLSRNSLPEYTHVHHRSLPYFNTPTVIYFVLEGS